MLNRCTHIIKPHMKALVGNLERITNEKGGNRTVILSVRTHEKIIEPAPYAGIINKVCILSNILDSLGYTI